MCFLKQVKEIFLSGIFHSCDIFHKTSQEYDNCMQSVKIAELRMSETDTIDMDSRLAFF